ncbi:FIST signal transduction protein [Holophaga foetida]|uniref:FIST signal transduction protein n=1 Tax=Holophaga foetida TaxID=35839 RepID=UPI0002473F0E|nr:FIST N-terminal domain-containing protein [Holophaga foetida]
MCSVFYAALAQVEVVDPRDAVREATGSCLGQLMGRRAGAALLFAGVGLDHQILLEGIQAQWPGIPIIGCTTDGEFSGLKGYTEDSLLLIILGSETATFASACLDLAEPLGPQCEAFRDRHLGTFPRVGILLADGLSYGGEEAMNALQGAFGAGIPWLGGASADRWEFKGNFQFHGTGVLTGSAVCLLLGGSFRYGFAVDSGWKPIGRTGVVTRADRNIVHDIDGKPALDFYRELMGDGALPFIDTPTAVYDPCDSFLFLRTSIFPLDPEGDSIRYSASVAEGSRVRVTLVDRDAIVEAVRRSVHRAKGMFGEGSPALALCFSCAVRRVILGSRTLDESRTACSTLGGGVLVAGPYLYGEISPLEAGTPSLYHNESFVTLLLE